MANEKILIEWNQRSLGELREQHRLHGHNAAIAANRAVQVYGEIDRQILAGKHIMILDPETGLMRRLMIDNDEIEELDAMLEEPQHQSWPGWLRWLFRRQ